MTHLLHNQRLLDTLPLSPTVSCSYFEDQLSRYREFRLDGELDPFWMELTLAKGYRRCGDVYYQTNCPACHRCQSYRIDVKRFRPTRSQRRVLRRNNDVTMELKEPVASAEKEAIYLRYQREQHHQKLQQIEDESIRRTGYNPERLLDTMYYQMYTNPSLTRELELRLDDTLIGFGNLDVALHSASAVYFVFDPEHSKRSLGTLAILRGLQWAASRKIRFYYLGYYIAGHPKMSYKERYRPAEVYDTPNGTWHPFEPDHD